jgi:hypothetical protein
MAETTSDEGRRVAGYLLGQGEKYGWLDLWPRVVEGRLAYLEEIHGLSEEQAGFRPNPEAWTIREITYHVLTGSRAVADTIAALASGQSADRVRWTDPAQEPTSASLAELRRDLLADSVAFSSLATRFSDDVSLEPAAPHGMFGPLHCRAWFILQRVHDQDHAGQVQAVKQSAGYPA